MKKNMKKGFALALAVLMALSSAPSTMAFAEEGTPTQTGWAHDHSEYHYIAEDGSLQTITNVTRVVEPANCKHPETTIYTVVLPDGEKITESVETEGSEKTDAHVAGNPALVPGTEEPATCTEDGKKTVVTKCKVCDEELTKPVEVKIPALGHKPTGKFMESYPVPASCTEDAHVVITYLCEREGCAGVSTEHRALSDAEKEILIKEFGEEALVKHHNWQISKVIKAGTCTTAGEAEYICPDCDATKTDVIPAGHKIPETGIQENVKEPTCTKEGSYDLVYRCTTCNEIQKTEHKVVKATGHQAPKKDGKEVFEIVTEPTCTTAGLKKATCTVKDCGEEFTVEIPKTGHDYKAEIVRDETFIAPTCITVGHHYEILTCQNEGCGETTGEAKYVEVPKLGANGHRWVPVEGKCVLPTCEEEGVGLVKCEICDEERNETGRKYVNIFGVPVYRSGIKELDALGHKVSSYEKDEESYKAPTCSKAGEYDKVGTCSRCGEKVTIPVTEQMDESLKAIAHTWKKVEVEKTTCTTDGEIARTCTVCGFTGEKETVPAYGKNFVEMCKELGIEGNAHPFVKDVKASVAPTCNAKGKDVYKCAKCDAIAEVEVSNEDVKCTEFVKKVVKANGPSEGNCSTGTKYVISEVCKVCGTPNENVTPIEVEAPNNHMKFDEKTGEFVSAIKIDTVNSTATCRDAGTIVGECENCKKKFTNGEISLFKNPELGVVSSYDPATGKVTLAHKWNETVVREATCGSCGNKYKDTYYNDADEKVTVESTGTGYVVRVCSVCGKNENEIIPAPASCKWEVVNERASWNDDFSKFWVVTTSKCLNNPSHTKTTTVAIPAEQVEKDIKEIVKEDCSKVGEYSYIFKYELDGKNYTISGTFEKPKTNDHKAGDPVIENANRATCTEAGTYESVVYCEVCGKELSRVKVDEKAREHRFDLEKYNKEHPDRVEIFDDIHDGKYILGTCMYCGEEMKEKVANYTAIGHTPGKLEKVDEKEPTCTEDGGYKLVIKCLDDDTILSTTEEVIPAKGHSTENVEVRGYVAPTDTEDGYTGDTYCLDCGEIAIKGEVIPATNRPAAPVVKAVGIAPNTVQLTWDAVEGADGYLVFGTNADGNYHKLGMTASTSFLDEHAKDVDYNFYWVFSYRIDDGKVVASEASQYVWAKGIACPAVTGLKATSAKGKVTLTWDKVAKADGYIITGIRPGQAYANLGNTTNTTWTDTKADTSDYTFYWVFGYRVIDGKQVVGATAHYTYGKAR